MKKIAVMLAVLALFAALYVLVPGFSKQGSAYISEYSVSADGREMTVTVGVSGPVGYIRKINVHQQQGGKLYLDCYSAFGGVNGSIGAKTEYTIRIDEATETIALYRAPNAYAPVLQKDESGAWQFITDR